MHQYVMACEPSDHNPALGFEVHQLRGVLAQGMAIIQERDSINGKVLGAL